jgi:nitrate/TMAO reductase-like tetraheme cytochrome c subunit
MKRVAVLLLVFGMNLAHAEAGKLSAPNNAKWKQECGACHDAYPPEFLTAANWRELMATLDKHFGASAVLDAKVNKEILRYLETNAGSGDRYSAASLRITETPWFKHDHRVINPKEWTNPQVKSRSNCSACHGKVILGD